MEWVCAGVALIFFVGGYLARWLQTSMGKPKKRRRKR